MTEAQRTLVWDCVEAGVACGLLHVYECIENYVAHSCYTPIEGYNVYRAWAAFFTEQQYHPCDVQTLKRQIRSYYRNVKGYTEYTDV